MQKHNYAILLAGGYGSRFWPQSRTLEPKQFLSLHPAPSKHINVELERRRGASTLFEQTIKRINKLIPAKNIFIVTSELYRNQIPDFIAPFKIPSRNVIFEPEPKNTAPSIGIATRLINIIDPSARVCILPCDHAIKNKEAFLRTLGKALNISHDNLIVFGIPVERPATGYGYIKVKSKFKSQNSKVNIFEVERFIEKPNIKKAKKIFRDKRYFWNSGIFAGSCRKFLQEIKINLPGLYAQLTKINSLSDINKVWGRLAPISFDYGVLEKSKYLLMIKADGLGWSDLGSWQAWDEMAAKNKDGNNFIADTVDLGSRNITVLGSKRLIATIGLEDLIIVDTPDALLITKKDRSEEVKKIVEFLKKNKRPEYYLHRTVKRPWGAYTVLDTAKDFKVKLVEVKPKRALSLQLHKRRSEHWVVVEGKAKIIKGKKSYIINSNESTFIPVGCVHRLINPSDSVIKIVEVQAGNYLEEDDIVRLKDDFGRVTGR